MTESNARVPRRPIELAWTLKELAATYCDASDEEVIEIHEALVEVIRVVQADLPGRMHTVEHQMYSAVAQLGRVTNDPDAVADAVMGPEFGPSSDAEPNLGWFAHKFPEVGTDLVDEIRTSQRWLREVSASPFITLKTP
jgi:hypothetical protein